MTEAALLPLLDDIDVQRAGSHTIVQRKSDGYWQIIIDRQVLYLHRWIMDAPKGSVVEHLNGDRSDNRRCNLRVTTQSVNKCNPTEDIATSESGVRGVVPQRSKWRAQIHRHGVRYNLGTFDTIEEAAAARKAAEKEYHHEHSSH